jgi:hypothetical protein
MDQFATSGIRLKTDGELFAWELPTASQRNSVRDKAGAASLSGGHKRKKKAYLKLWPLNLEHRIILAVLVKAVTTE